MTHIYRIFLGTWLIAGMLTAQAQYSWSNLGPDNLSSPVRALAYDAQGRLLAGAQGGGLWRSANEGESWERIASFDDAGGNPNISSIAVSGNLIFVATGAVKFTRTYSVSRLNFNPTYDYRTDPTGFKGYLDGQPGGGVFVSTDNGATWSNANATTTGTFGSGTLNYKGPFTSIQKVLVKGNRVFVATAEGLFYSDDNLATIQKSEGPDFFKTRVVFDVEAAAGDVVMATVHEDSNSPVDSVGISYDNGTTFTLIKNTLLYPNEGQEFSRSRAELAVAPSDPNIVYLAGAQSNEEVSGIWRFNVAENRWITYGPSGSAGFSPLGSNGRNAFVLAVFPDNANEVILAGQNWFTYKQDRGWTNSTAQHSNPNRTNYIPRSMLTVLFKPGDPKTMVIGTTARIIVSKDRGVKFAGRTRGFETGFAYSAASFSTQIEGEDPNTYDAVVGGTGNIAMVYNRHYTESGPSKQSFGQLPVIVEGALQVNNYTEVAVSVLHPGSILAQGSDGGLVRSLNFGETFEKFYGTPISPQVKNLIPAVTDTFIDRASGTAAGGVLFNGPTPAQSTWVLDEVIPENLLDRADLTEEELLAGSDSYVFFCSRNYVWLVNGALGDGLQVKWNRITPQLVNGSTEFLTAITVSGDTNHTVYVGSSQGNLWRITRAHDLANFDVATNITQINNQVVNNLFQMSGRWISSLAVDPKNPNRLIVTYAGFGGNVANVPTFVWVTDSARAAAPVFGQFLSFAVKEPIYSAQYVEDPAETGSVLLLGAQTNLYSVRGISRSTNPRFYNVASRTEEFTNALGSVPVYDVFVRRYVSRLRESALVRKEVRVRTLPNGTVVTDTVELEKDNLILSKDNSIYVATLGRGFWSTASTSVKRDAGNPGEVPVVEKEQVILYPNPTQGTTYLGVEVPYESSVSIQLLGIDGRQISQRYETLVSGSYEFDLVTDVLTPGIYLVRVEIENEKGRTVHVQKAVILE
ncbi:MAG: T9SS C-terminal target domain-containing protein [Bacteroidetes bacterium]|nr:MAG: T9SS C-terminal target domain-containing protein [Bacteroidota bacterium]